MPKFTYKILEWQDTDEISHPGAPKPEDLERTQALKVAYTNQADPEDVRYYIVRHPTSFRTVERMIFDIEFTAERSGGIELAHA